MHGVFGGEPYWVYPNEADKAEYPQDRRNARNPAIAGKYAKSPKLGALSALYTMRMEDADFEEALGKAMIGVATGGLKVGEAGLMATPFGRVGKAAKTAANIKKTGKGSPDVLEATAKDRAKRLPQWARDNYRNDPAGRVRVARRMRENNKARTDRQNFMDKWRQWDKEGRNFTPDMWMADGKGNKLGFLGGVPLPFIFADGAGDGTGRAY